MSEDEYYYSDEDGYAYDDGGGSGTPSGGASSPIKPSPSLHTSASGGASSGGAAGVAARAHTHTHTHTHTPAATYSRVMSGTVATAASSAEYRLLAPEEIELEQSRIISDVAGVLAIPSECAATLLIAFKWNKERLLDAYTGDPVRVAKEAGIAHLGVSSAPPGPFTCTICLDDYPAREGFGLGCKHYFCKGCWSGFLTAAVTDNGQSCIFSKCPESGCGEAITLSVVKAMAPPDIADTWRRFELQQFVNISKNMAWCPKPGCSNAFIARGPVKTVACSCGMKFCFKCSREAHEPVVCEQNEIWYAKCGNESETANWILANTKRCPACGTRIEKNQGCNHMVCRSKGCKFEFCWVCLGPWSEHGQSTGGFYKCNKFKEAATTDTSDAARAKAELDKYLFYYQRFTNHDQAGKFAAKHRETAQRRMAELQAAGGLAYSDVTFLNDATEALLECRRVLKYTYVYGYYMKDGPEKRLFEHLQEQLERSTEHLAELTEKPVDKMDRSEVVNFTRVTMQFLRNLLSGIEDGLTTL